MDALIVPTQNRLYVVVGRHAAAERLLDLTARLALRGPVLILDCGNRANPYPLARELRRLTNDPVRALRNIQTARAFTCYQVITLLEGTARRPAPYYPVLIFDLLATFYDESVSYAESRRLLKLTLTLIQDISRGSPLMISAAPPHSDFPQRKHFLEALCERADEIWEEAPPPDNTAHQLSLFASGG